MNNLPFKPSQSCYSIKEACAYLRLSESSIRRLMERGLLKYSKALRNVKLLGDSVETLWERTS